MLAIDGAHGEGGGQIVRNAVALAAITGTAVRIDRIRAGRKKPGLFPQHIAAVRAAACACDAGLTGVEPGSSSLTFSPGALKPCEASVSVGTAGCIPLVIQAWLPVALMTGGKLKVSGGTEVPWGPTTEYMDHVFFAVLKRAGAGVDLEIMERGYYPTGGGCVTVDVKKGSLSPIRPAEMEERPCGIASCSSNLPGHVTERQALAAAKYIGSGTGAACHTEIDARTGPSTGSSCTVWRGAKGGSALGKRGLPAATVGESAAREALEAFRSPGTVDTHLADQLLLPLALFGGDFTTAALTPHAETTIWLLGQFGYSINVQSGTPVEFSS